eukprot:403372049
MSSNDNQLYQTSGASAFASVNNSTESKKQAFKNATLINLQNVDFHHKLGEGAFGKVFLVKETLTSDPNSDEDSTEDEKSSGGSLKNSPVIKRKAQSDMNVASKVSPLKKDTKKVEFYAVKILSKHQIMKAKQVDHVFNEMTLQQQLRHPFIVNMEGIQQDQRSLYIKMEFVEGGELFKVVQSFGHLDVAWAKFYASQIILVFEYLHSKNFIYRDLKPENVLIHQSGYLKLSDFGFIKYLKPGERTYTLCGTPEYLAPEIILNKGHGKAVDWYCLGIFLYEMMVGRCPYMHEDPYEIFKKIISEKIRFPRSFDSAAKSIIRHLTDNDLSRRYGNLRHGSEDIKNHRFFADINFYNIVTQAVKPVYIPPLNADRRKKLLKEPGQHYKLIDVNRDNIISPVIVKSEDPFAKWF